MDNKYKDKVWLEEQYCELSNTQKEIASKTSVTPTTIHNWIHRYQIECGRGYNSKKAKKRYKENLKNKFDNKIELIGEYNDASVKTLHCCKVCNTEFKATPHGMLHKSKYGCPQCAQQQIISHNKANFSKSQNEYIKELAEKFQYKIIPSEQYVNKETPIQHYCSKHRYLFYKKPCNILKLRYGCPKCAGDIQAKNQYISQIEYAKRLIQKLHLDIVPLEELNGLSNRIKHKCLRCGYQWMATPLHKLNNKTRCPNCQTNSRGEEIVSDLLEEYDVNFIQGGKFKNCKDKYCLRFDFVLLHNLTRLNKIKINNALGGIEYDGIQHFEPVEYFGGEDKFEDRQRHDNMKNEFCEDNNIPLLRVNYKDYNRGEIKQKVDQFIRKLK